MSEGRGIPWFVWAVVTIATAWIGAYAVMHSGRSSPAPVFVTGGATSGEEKPSPVSANSSVLIPPTSAVDLVALNKSRLVSAITLADNAEIGARRSLDPSALYDAYKGEALRTELAGVRDLKANGLFVVSQLEDQKFQSFKVSPDGLRAEVRVIETWSTTYYSAANQTCMGYIQSHAIPQTIFLERGEDGWIVDAISQEGKSPDPLPCQ